MPGTAAPPVPADVAAILAGFAPPLRAVLLAMRDIIFATAAETSGVGPLTETLKWGEPAYLTAATRSGSTIRLGQSRKAPDHAALFLNCNTTLVPTLRGMCPDTIRFEGNRAMLVPVAGPFPAAEVALAARLALTYHSAKRAVG